MSDNKTKPTRRSALKYIASLENPQRRADANILLPLMHEITGKKPVLWGDSIIGFGQYHYRYASGREGDFPVVAFSPRKQNTVIYIMPGFKKYSAVLAKLGKHKHSVSCLYLNKLDDVSLPVLRRLIIRAVNDMQKMYACT